MAAQPDTGEPYVFLSYTSADRERVLALADRLEANGVRVWVDRRDIAGGSSWDTSIVHAISHCTVFALSCSPAALGSPNVQQEVRLAWEERRPVLPLLLESVTIPPDLRYPLAGRQWVELLDRSEDTWLPDVLRAFAGLGLAPPPVAPTSSPTEPPMGSLPTPLTSLIGRDLELAELTTLLRTTRLLTLTGPGGTGKTRLALAAAAAVAGSFPDGAWFVDLAGVADPAGVIPAIAQVLNVRESEGRSLAVSLAAYLRSKRLLLVVDNFEQVVTAAMALYDLLAEAPALVVLVTSRVLLRVGGEQEYVVPPLPLPEATALDNLGHNPAVQLFTARAQALRRDFAVTSANAATIAAICTRLEGLPLAIELAAARIKLLAPAALLTRLEHRLAFLTGGARSLPQRQQTLRATITWSWDLLSEAEQRLFRRLGVFAGGWTLAAVEAVCDGEGDLGVDVLDGLTSLVDKSLVRQPEVNGEPRLSLLFTLREFALEQLELSGEAQELYRRHAGYFCTVAEQADAAYWGSGHLYVNVLRLLDPERDNLAAALGWALATEDAALGLRLCGALGMWFSIRAPGEACRWADALLRVSAAEAQRQALGRTLTWTGICALVQGDVAAGVAHLEEAVAVLRAVEDLPCLSLALSSLSFNLPAPEAARARAVADEALALAHATGNAHLLGFVEANVGLSRRAHSGDLAAARAHLDTALRLARGLDADYLTLYALLCLAIVVQEAGLQLEAQRLWREVRPLAEAFKDRNMTTWACIYGALQASEEGDQPLAARDWRTALTLARDVSSTPFRSICLAGIAGLLAARSLPERAARLLGASSAAWGDGEHYADFGPTFRAAREPALVATQAAVSPAVFQAAWREGEALSLDQATALALTLLPSDAPNANVENPVISDRMGTDTSERVSQSPPL